MANVASAERILMRYISNGNKQVSRAFSFKAFVIGSFIGNVHSELDIPVAKRTLIKHCSSGQCTQARDAHPNFSQLKDSKPDNIIKCLNYKLASICETYSIPRNTTRTRHEQSSYTHSSFGR